MPKIKTDFIFKVDNVWSEQLTTLQLLSKSFQNLVLYNLEINTTLLDFGAVY